jgi:hypothetical protein
MLRKIVYSNNLSLAYFCGYSMEDTHKGQQFRNLTLDQATGVEESVIATRTNDRRKHIRLLFDEKLKLPLSV